MAARPALSFSFSGTASHAKLTELHEFVFDCPLERLVLASDGPFLPPSECGGRRGSFAHPAHVALVARRVAQLKRLPLLRVLRAALANTRRLLGRHAPGFLPVEEEEEDDEEEEEGGEEAEGGGDGERTGGGAGAEGGVSGAADEGAATGCGDGWVCTACTFINEAGDAICLDCGLPRDIVDA